MRHWIARGHSCHNALLIQSVRLGSRWKVRQIQTVVPRIAPVYVTSNRILTTPLKSLLLQSSEESPHRHHDCILACSVLNTYICDVIFSSRCFVSGGLSREAESSSFSHFPFPPFVGMRRRHSRNEASRTIPPGSGLFSDTGVHRGSGRSQRQTRNRPQTLEVAPLPTTGVPRNDFRTKIAPLTPAAS